MKLIKCLIMLLWVGLTRGNSRETRCGITLCDRQRHRLFCNQGKLLLTNVTDDVSGDVEDWAFQNLRRLCMGKLSCDPSSFGFCDKRKSLRVSYLCVTETDQQCGVDVISISNNEGFIMSPQYPDTTIQRCRWRIDVPSDHYVIITIHDVVHSGHSDKCVAGIKLQTSKKCVNHTVPERMMCKPNAEAPFLACGPVDITLVPSDSGLIKVRLWMSYRIVRFTEMPEPNYLSHLTNTCPEGTYLKNDVTSPPSSAGDVVIQPEAQDTNRSDEGEDLQSTHNTTILTRNQVIPPNHTEKAVFYIAIVIAVLSLTGLIIVTIVCIRRQRHLKATGVISGHHISLNGHNANRPLPPIDKHRGTETNGNVPGMDHTIILDGYSRVADEIPFGTGTYITRSAAYAEVGDSLNSVQRQPIRFALRHKNRKQSLENVYSDVEVGRHDRNIYHEIPDTESLTSSVPKSTDQKKLGRKTTDSNVSHSKHARYRKPSIDDSYAYCELSEKKKIISKDFSDSDGSLVLMDNEIYDAYQSAHV